MYTWRPRSSCAVYARSPCGGGTSLSCRNGARIIAVAASVSVTTAPATSLTSFSMSGGHQATYGECIGPSLPIGRLERQPEMHGEDDVPERHERTTGAAADQPGARDVDR